MPADKPTLCFEGTVETYSRPGMVASYAIALPPSTIAALGEAGKRRFLCNLNGFEIERSLISDGEGGYSILIGKQNLKDAKLNPGARLQVEMTEVDDPNQVEVPEELAAALNLEPGAWAAYERLTPGRRRNLNVYILQTKRPETRAQRAAEVLGHVLSGRYITESQRKKMSQQDEG